MSIIDTIFFISIFRPYFCRIEINNKQKTKEKMKEHFQDYGVRRWAGDDLIELQSEPLEAIQRLVEPYAPCIIQGCDLEEEGGTRRIGAGLVALWQVDESGRKQGVKIARFGGCTPSSLPVYLTLQCSTENRVYADGRSKAIAYLYEARETSLEEEARGRYPLVIGPEGGVRLAENLYVGFAGAAERKNIEPGERLSELFGKVRRWFSDMKGLAFKEKVSESDLEAALRGKLEGKVDKESGKGLSGNDFTDALKGKLEGIADGAQVNAVTSVANRTGAVTLKKSDVGLGNVDNTSDAQKPVSAAVRQALDGKADSNHTHGYLPLSGGTVSGNLRLKGGGNYGNKLNFGDNEYVYLHEAADDKLTIYSKSGIDFAANGTSMPFNVKGQLQENGTRVYSPGNRPAPGDIGAAAASHTHSAASTSAAGLMSAADKKNLDSLFKFRIVGYYTFNALGNVSSYIGFPISCNKSNTPVNPCYRITLNTSGGFSANKSYFIIGIAGLGHMIECYDTFVSGGSATYIVYRDNGGKAELSDFAPRIVIVELN